MPRALVSWRTCASTLWPSVETLAYPNFMLLIWTSLTHRKSSLFSMGLFVPFILIYALDHIQLLAADLSIVANMYSQEP